CKVACVFLQYRTVKLFRMIIGLLFILFASSGEALACPLELPAATISIKGHSLTVELAATPTARACGLAHRNELPPTHGMLFIFPDVRPATFWMKDTRIPLSIAFVDESGKIINIRNMAPMQTDVQYHSAGPAKYALEVNQGWFKKNGIEAGDHVVMELPLVIDIK
ncbi:MAG: DUF192 domain-containing protein, partial [Desulfobacterales bacterium]